MSKDIIEIIKGRRSVRSYLDKEVNDELLKEILISGTYAPSGMNKQSPYFVLIKNKKVRDYYAMLNARVLGNTNDPYYGAPYIIIVLAEPSIKTYVEDASCAIMNMMLTAESIGVSSCWIHREKEIFNSKEGKELLKEWNLPTSLVGVGSLAIGYLKGDKPLLKPRKGDYYKIV